LQREANGKLVTKNGLSLWCTSEEYGVDQAATGSAQSEPVFSVRGLVRRYGSHEVVAGIDLEVLPARPSVILGLSRSSCSGGREDRLRLAGGKVVGQTLHDRGPVVTACTECYFSSI
jgi:hypothetical protein